MLFLVVGAALPGWHCSPQIDNGRGAILREIPEGAASGKQVTVELGPASGFPPQRQCKALAGGEVVAEADYPSEGVSVAAMLISLLPILAVAWWRAVHRRRRPPLNRDTSAFES
jgi:hypothetical protein